MVTDLPHWMPSLAWPLLLLAAWVLGEQLHALWRVPRVSSYVAAGLLAGFVGQPALTEGVPGLFFLANTALALVLFELGYRIHLRWFRHNPWVLAVGVVESAVTFGLVYWAAGGFGLAPEVRLIVAALAISASPAGIVRVANELRGAGQVTERVMHLCAINCLLSVLAVKLVVGYWHLSTSGDWGAAALGSVYALVISVALGGALGVLVPWLLRHRPVEAARATAVFALAVLLLATVSQALMLSPLLAALSFGIVARERRVQLTPAQRNFGSAGELLGLFLFVYVATLIDWPAVPATVGLALTLLALRVASKALCNLAVARLSGITARKGWLTGLALTPMSAFAILLLEQSRLYGFAPATEAFAAMAALMVLQELLGPWVTQRSLMAARETHLTAEAAPGAASPTHRA
ncbi:cation:proton antiporter [Aquabacterium sp. A08]|uniref:cation:proton antiporter n=1 Tax=Aquabacterium sp. A08 TaxID=2718532 RepID=UPI00141DCECB|nr:cation:proton antiporter [Aquabacterium sp. A08]NIC41631.1 cation:proton antiporter [Aquabacterium sp. A08]NIC41658.1 cation:proton antiporter [Aquabacterium sp. A08]